MLRGILLGSVSGLALSGLLVASASLVAVPPGAVAHRPVAVVPDAPLLRDQAEARPRMPEALPERVPVEVTEREPVTVVAAPPAKVAEPGGEAGVGESIAAAVPLPAASGFNLSREDGVVVTPQADPVARPPATATEGLQTAVPTATDLPSPQTESTARPRESRIEGFGAAPEAGEGPDLPRPLVERAPQTFAAVAPEEGPLEGPAQMDAIVPIETRAAAVPSASEPPITESPVEEAPVEKPPVAETPVTEPPATESPVAETAEAARPAPERNAEHPTIQLVDEAERVTPPPVAAETGVPATTGPAQESPDAAGQPGAMPQRLLLDSERVARARSVEVNVAGRKTGPVALEREAAAFDNPENLPLFAVVLIDDTDADSVGDPVGAFDRENLLAFEFPVTFAIDPTRPDAAEVARAYRDAGHEVVLLSGSLAPEGSAQDIEIAVEAARAAVPQALGVLDGAAGDFAGNRTALEALLPALAEAGMGFVAYPSGLNSGIAEARREGVPAMPTYRALDDGEERATVIGRYLDRATFEAAQDGAIVVVGRARPDTVAALNSWHRGARSGDVAAAPLSAVLLGFGT